MAGEVRQLIDAAQRVHVKPARKIGRPRGKRSNPDYETTTVLIDRRIKWRAQRLVKCTAMDMSELTNLLLKQWVEQQEKAFPKECQVDYFGETE